MIGKYEIIVENKKVKYRLEIKRNITVIRGDSATGKSTLVSMINDFYNLGKSSGVNVICSKECRVLEGKDWMSQLEHIDNSIVFVDEGNPFVTSRDFSRKIKHSNNYYVLITRERLTELPYSVQEIYGIRQSGKYQDTKLVYNETYKLYGGDGRIIRPKRVIVEDETAGFEFFNILCKKYGITCEAAKGKSNVFKKIDKNITEKVLLIVDGAAFGSEMDLVMKCISIYTNYVLYAPESFEYLILKSGLLKDKDMHAEIDVDEIINIPEQYAESTKYYSWERFFNKLLEKKTQDIKGWHYDKTELNQAYQTERALKLIPKVMQSIEFKDKNE